MTKLKTALISITIAVAVLLLLLTFSTASTNAQQPPHYRGQRIADAARNKIPPSASAMANSFAAKPHGDKTSDNALTAATGNEVAAAKQGGNQAPQHQQQQRREHFGIYRAPSAAYTEAFQQLGAGNMTAVGRLHQLALDEADGHAMMLLGVLYSTGVGVPRSDAKAKLYHTFAAMSGVAESIVVLALDEETAGNCDEAVEWAKKAADISARFNSDGSITPRWDASRLTQLEHKEATTTESEFDVQLLLAERGNGPACCAVGYAYMLGLNGVEQDGHAAKIYFERGIELGEAACFSGMGQLYARGVAGGAHPVSRDPKLAAKYYKLGAEKNHAPSLNGLGYLHAAGALNDNGERDFEGAFSFFEQSAALNNAPGTYNIGLLYLNGKGTVQDTHKALQKFQRAASMGSLLATYQLANMFAVGAGPVHRNCRVALGHYNQVQRLGPWNLRWNMARAALYGGLHQQHQEDAGRTSQQQQRHNKQHQQQEEEHDQQQTKQATAASEASQQAQISPGEALLHYLILGAMGRPKASQNAMFVIERFFDETHPLVSFNGTSGSTAWRDDALMQLAMDAGDELDADEEMELALASSEFTGSYRSVLLHRLVLDAARHGSADAKLDLAAHFWDGIGTPRNRIKAREAYQAAAAEGSVEAMWMLGWLHSTTAEEQDHEWWWWPFSSSSSSSSSGKASARQILEAVEQLREKRKALLAEKKEQRAIANANANNKQQQQQQQRSSKPKSSIESGGDSSSTAATTGRRKRRIAGLHGGGGDGSSGASADSFATTSQQGQADSSSRAARRRAEMRDSQNTNNNGGGIVGRNQRDIHRAKYYYDQVAEMFPSAWFAVRLALMRLNFLWWYDHFISKPALERSAAAVSAATGSGSSSSSRITTPALTEGVEYDTAKSKLGRLSLKQTYFVVRQIALDLLKMMDPIVMWGLSVSEILILLAIGFLITLLLVRHHAFGV